VIVADASAVIESLLRLPSAHKVDAHLFSAGQTLHAPHLIDVEVAQVLRRFALAGTIDAKRGYEAVSDLANLPLRRYPHDVLLPRIWALRANFSAYDAVYVALAEALGAPLLTCDARLAAAAATHAGISVV
jgi:predicted nucleic acid-binding protein